VAGPWEPRGDRLLLILLPLQRFGRLPCPPRRSPPEAASAEVPRAAGLRSRAPSGAPPPLPNRLELGPGGRGGLTTPNCEYVAASLVVLLTPGPSTPVTLMLDPLRSPACSYRAPAPAARRRPG